MGLVVQCSKCNAQFKLDDKYAGKNVRCSKCQTVISVPQLHQATSDSALPVATRLPPDEPPSAKDQQRTIPAPPSAAAPAPRPAVPPVQRETPKPPTNACAFPPIRVGEAPSPFSPEAKIDATAAGTTQTPSGQKTSPSGVNLPMLLAGGGVAALLLIVGVAGYLMWNSDSPSSSPSILAKGPSATSDNDDAVSVEGDAELVLNWGEADRQNASVVIDDQRKKIPSGGAIRYPLSVGDHRVVLQRRGYDQLEVIVSLKEGDTHTYTPKWEKSLVATRGEQMATFGNSAALTPRGFMNWRQDFETAQRDAAAEGKQIMLVFAGSDWEPLTQRVARRLLGTYDVMQRLKTEFELVVIDFPKTVSGFNVVPDHDQNRHLRQKFGVRSIPTLVLTDAEGVPYAIEKLADLSVDAFFSKLETLKGQRIQRDELIAATTQGDDIERLNACAEACEWLAEHEMTHFHMRLIESWLRRAEADDPENGQGLHEVIYFAHWMNQIIHAGKNAPQKQQEIAKALLDWGQERKFKDPDRAANMYLVAAQIVLAFDADLATELVTDGIRYSPTEARLKEALIGFAGFVKNRNELGSGTGFAIAEGGYVLTNHHVIKGGRRIVIRRPDMEADIPVEVLAKDPERDLALLKVPQEIADQFVPLSIVASPLSRGARVAVFGYPLGTAVGAGLKLTTGVVSALPETGTEGMLVLDCTVNPGNSGGPLCDTRGSVVGVVTAKSAAGFSVESYGMAVPGSAVVQFLSQNLPNYVSGSEPTDSPLEWDAVDRKVSPSVVMIVSLR